MQVSNLKEFGEKVKSYLRSRSGKRITQKEFQEKVNLNYYTLGDLLNGRYSIKEENINILHGHIRMIVKGLVTLEAITYRSQVTELLDIIGCPDLFSEAEWRTPLLIKLKPVSQHWQETHYFRVEASMSKSKEGETLDERRKYAALYLNEGVDLENEGKLNEALDAYKHSIRLNPDDADAHYNKGRVLDEMGRYKEALIAYEDAIRLDPNYTYAYFNKGVTLYKMKRNQEAEDAYKQAMLLDLRVVNRAGKSGFSDSRVFAFSGSRYLYGT